MSRKAARIARKNEKKLRDQEKNVRLIAQVVEDHTPRVSKAVSEDSTPRSIEDPQSIMKMKMEYNILDCSDRKDAWSWGQNRNWCETHNDAENSCAIRSTMIEMSALYWSEIYSQTTGSKERHKKHHSQSWDTICEEAQNRWIEIDRGEDELFRFRTGARSRIWGYREGHVFYVVWWDPDHQIYPTEAS